MRRALQLAAHPRGARSARTHGSAACCSTTAGTEVAEGFHRGAGHPHAEVEALPALGRPGDRAHRRRHARAVQPHRPHRPVRQAPCSTRASRRVVFAQADTSPRPPGERRRCATGGRRRRRGAARRRGPRASTGPGPSPPSTAARSSPGSSPPRLDGRSAAADGTSRWVSNAAARRDTHRLRGECDVVLAGTGTVLVDDPQLTVRDEVDEPLPREQQPLRAVMGLRDLPGRPPGPRRRRRDRAPAHPRPARGARRALRPRPPARLPRGRAAPGAPPSSAPGWSTRSSPTSRRCSSATAPTPSRDSRSAPSPTPCGSTSPTSPSLGTRRATATCGSP